MSYDNYRHLSSHQIAGEMLGSLRSIETLLTTLIEVTRAAQVTVVADESAPILILAEPELKTWKVQTFEPLGPFSTRPEVDVMVSSWLDPSVPGGFTHIYVGQPVSGAVEVEAAEV